MTALLQKYRTKPRPKTLRACIKGPYFGKHRIIAIESEAPAITRKKLKQLFGKSKNQDRPTIQAAELIGTEREMQKYLKSMSLQLRTNKNEKVFMPLILLAPSKWNNFHRLMEKTLEIFEGPIYLVDNSSAAANWANAFECVNADGKFIE